MSAQRITQLDDIGDQFAPAGSPSWVAYYLNQAKQSSKKLNFDVSILQGILKVLDEHEAWKTRGYMSFEMLCAKELDLAPEVVTSVLSAPKHAKLGDVIRNTRELQLPHRPRKGSQCLPLPKGSNSSARIVARLKRHHPEIAKRIEGGEFKSIHAAAIEAGLKTKTITVPLDTKRALAILKKYFKHVELGELR